MNKRTWELWGIPIVIGLLLLIASLYLNSWATGAPLRPPFTGEWIKALLAFPVHMPLWMLLLVVASPVVAWLFLRRRSEGKSTANKTSNPEGAVAYDNKSVIEQPSALIPPEHPAFPSNGADGAHRNIVRFMMYGLDQLMAYTTTRDGFPGTRYLIVRNRPGQHPQSLETSDRTAANAKWTEWYREQKAKGFGGWSGNGLDGESPF